MEFPNILRHAGPCIVMTEMGGFKVLAMHTHQSFKEYSHPTPAPHPNVKGGQWDFQFLLTQFNKDQP